jgi:hypothetical protein
MAQNCPTPRAAYRGAPSSATVPPTPEVKQLFDDERLPNASSKTFRKPPQVEIHTQGQPPSMEAEQLEQKSVKVRFPTTHSIFLLLTAFFF